MLRADNSRQKSAAPKAANVMSSPSGIPSHSLLSSTPCGTSDLPKRSRGSPHRQRWMDRQRAPPWKSNRQECTASGSEQDIRDRVAVCEFQSVFGRKDRNVSVAVKKGPFWQDKRDQYCGYAMVSGSRIRFLVGDLSFRRTGSRAFLPSQRSRTFL